ncbi:peptidoglycan-binding protein, partial [Almyronema epifaneia S1]
NQSTLNRLRSTYPQAYLDSSSQGNFVNTGAFRDRNSAFARMFELRSRGFDARVVYRSVSYR